MTSLAYTFLTYIFSALFFIYIAGIAVENTVISAYSTKSQTSSKASEEDATHRGPDVTAEAGIPETEMEQYTCGDDVSAATQGTESMVTMNPVTQTSFDELKNKIVRATTVASTEPSTKTSGQKSTLTIAHAKTVAFMEASFMTGGEDDKSKIVIEWAKTTVSTEPTSTTPPRGEIKLKLTHAKTVTSTEPSPSTAPQKTKPTIAFAKTIASTTPRPTEPFTPPTSPSNSSSREEQKGQRQTPPPPSASRPGNTFRAPSRLSTIVEEEPEPIPVPSTPVPPTKDTPAEDDNDDDASAEDEDDGSPPPVFYSDEELEDILVGFRAATAARMVKKRKHSFRSVLSSGAASTSTYDREGVCVKKRKIRVPGFVKADAPSIRGVKRGDDVVGNGEGSRKKQMVEKDERDEAGRFAERREGSEGDWRFVRKRDDDEGSREVVKRGRWEVAEKTDEEEEGKMLFDLRYYMPVRTEEIWGDEEL